MPATQTAPLQFKPPLQFGTIHCPLEQTLVGAWHAGAAFEQFWVPVVCTQFPA